MRTEVSWLAPYSSDSQFDTTLADGYLSGVNSKPISIEQQRAYVQAWVKYGPVMEQMKAEENRRMTPEEKWAAIDMVQSFGEQCAGPDRQPLEDAEENGLVIQQRYFMNLHRR